MRGVLRLLTYALAVGVTVHTSAYSMSESCHLHVPDDYPTFSKRPLVIPAVGNESECEQLNLERFSSRGRCHCAPDSISTERKGPAGFSKPIERLERMP